MTVRYDAVNIATIVYCYIYIYIYIQYTKRRIKISMLNLLGGSEAGGGRGGEGKGAQKIEDKQFQTWDYNREILKG